MNNTEATIAALVGPWTEPGETIVQGTQRVVELLQMNAELNSTLIMKSANPDYLPKTTREAIAERDDLQREADACHAIMKRVRKIWGSDTLTIDAAQGVQDRIEQLQKALQFYARVSNWECDKDGVFFMAGAFEGPTIIEADKGQTAKQVLYQRAPYAVCPICYQVVEYLNENEYNTAIQCDIHGTHIVSYGSRADVLGRQK